MEFHKLRFSEKILAYSGKQGQRREGVDKTSQRPKLTETKMASMASVVDLEHRRTSITVHALLREPLVKKNGYVGCDS